MHWRGTCAGVSSMRAVAIGCMPGVMQAGELAWWSASNATTTNLRATPLAGTCASWRQAATAR